MRHSSALRYGLAFLSLGGMLVLLVIIRLDRDSGSCLRRGDEFLRQGNTAEAMFYWKVAVSMYVPWASAPREAAERLLATGEDAIRRGEREEGVRAFRYARSAIRSVRHVRQPMQDLLVRADAGLREVEGGTEPEAG
jgi:hypothetical protein